MASNISQSLHSKSASTQTVHVVENSKILSKLIHELQKERGMSAGYVASDGRNFKTELSKQHESVNRALEDYSVIHDELERLDPELSAKIDRETQTLIKFRSVVLTLQATLPEVAKHYSDEINDLIKMISVDLENLPNAELTERSKAFVNMIYAKESAGLERAMGATGFGKGEFTQPIYRKFSNLIAGQNVFLLEVEEFAASRDKAKIRALRDSDRWNNLQALREIGLGSVFGTPMKDISSIQWFQTSTEWIELLKTTEDELSKTLLNSANKSLNKAIKELQIAGIIALMSLIISLALAYIVAKKLTFEIGSIVDVMSRVAEDDNDVEIPYRDRTDEISAIARMTDVFRQNNMKRHAMEEQAKLDARERQKLREEQSRSEQEIADREHRLKIDRQQKAEEQRLSKEKLRAEQAEQNQTRLKKQTQVFNALAEGLKKLSDGQLGYQIEMVFDGHHEGLRKDFNSSSTILHQTMSKISNTAVGMNTNLKEIGVAVNDLANRYGKCRSSH